MLTVGLGANQAQGYLIGCEDLVQIACYNSPSSVTLSGYLSELKKIKSRLEQDHHFARLLQVDLAYHSKFVIDISKPYEELLIENCEAPLSEGKGIMTMFSSVSGSEIDTIRDASYWVANAIDHVLFEQVTNAMVSGPSATNFLIELGPSGALAAPIAMPDRMRYALSLIHRRHSTYTLVG